MAVFTAHMETHFAKQSAGSHKSAGSHSSVATPEQTEASRFEFAETVLRAACPDPRLCPHHRCRRLRLCRHVADLRAVRDGTRKLPPSRRPPGATMIRHAIWVFVNSGR
jgi:hypothetical protein